MLDHLLVLSASSSARLSKRHLCVQGANRQCLHVGRVQNKLEEKSIQTGIGPLHFDKASWGLSLLFCSPAAHVNAQVESEPALREISAWLVDMKDISISSGTGGKELPPSCTFISAIFCSLPPETDFLSVRITPKCLYLAVLTGVNQSSCPHILPHFLVSSQAPGSNQCMTVDEESVLQWEGDGDRLCAQNMDHGENKDMNRCTNGNRAGGTSGF